MKSGVAHREVGGAGPGSVLDMLSGGDRPSGGWTAAALYPVSVTGGHGPPSSVSCSLSNGDLGGTRVQRAGAGPLCPPPCSHPRAGPRKGKEVLLKGWQASSTSAFPVDLHAGEEARDRDPHPESARLCPWWVTDLSSVPPGWLRLPLRAGGHSPRRNARRCSGHLEKSSPGWPGLVAQQGGCQADFPLRREMLWKGWVATWTGACSRPRPGCWALPGPILLPFTKAWSHPLIVPAVRLHPTPQTRTPPRGRLSPYPRESSVPWGAGRGEMVTARTAQSWWHCHSNVREAD